METRVGLKKHAAKSFKPEGDEGTPSEKESDSLRELISDTDTQEICVVVGDEKLYLFRPRKNGSWFVNRIEAIDTLQDILSNEELAA